MTYLVNSEHVESLRGGRLVGPGDEVSDADAKRNQHLIDRGVLTKRPGRKSSTKAGDSAQTAAKPQKEVSE